MTRVLASFVVGVMLVICLVRSAAAQISAPASLQVSPQVTMLNQAGDAVTALTDGDLVRFMVNMPEAVKQPTSFSIALDNESTRIAACRIPTNQRSCTTRPVGTLGWYWQEGKVMPKRMLHLFDATLANGSSTASLEIALSPRPVVLVHGFGSDYTTWLKYLGPSGYLALLGVRGFAIGDGQVAGTMYTGSLLNPSARTNTIADNAAALGEYIANVKALTGAEQVDLVVHSMGGLIARYYLDRVMTQRDVAQLIMLGTPNGGSNCAIMLGSLGLYEPAGLQLREDYVRNVFNPQITEQHGVPFYNFAGTLIQERLLSPCSKTPNDLVVSLDSAADAPVELVEVPLLHIDLTNSEALFTQHIAPLLQKSGIDFEQQGAQVTSRLAADEEPVQYSQVFTGVVTTSAGSTQVINIDSNVAVASFGLYDPSRSLTVTVRGASGNVITLTPAVNGLTVVTDPEALIYLGYGFENPRPGPWQVTVLPTSRTPPLGTEYAIVTQYVGGASVDAELSNHLPGLGEQVILTATMQVGGEAVALESAQVVLRHPDGVSETIPFTASGISIVAEWQPQAVGIYGIDVNVSAILPDGTVAQRSSYLAVEAFEDAPETRP
jgi:pimeloyl-ACP methyl ester carboxylesterase